MTRLTVLLQRLAVVAAAVALLGHGGVELAPRLLGGGASVGAASTATPSAARAGARPAAESKSAPVASVLRLALALAAPAGGADATAGPGSTPLVAPHLLARPVVRPPTPSYVRGIRGSASGRAPPAPAGT